MPSTRERRSDDLVICLARTYNANNRRSVERSAMNKVVRNHYPVSQLPDDLRTGFDKDATVRIVIEEQENSLAERSADRVVPSFFEYRQPGPPMKVADLLESIRIYKTSHAPSTDEEEAVRRIRELRDEWDDE